MDCEPHGSPDALDQNLVIAEDASKEISEQMGASESEFEEARAQGKTPVPGNSSMPRANSPKKAKKRPAGKPSKGRPKKRTLTFSDSEPSEVTISHIFIFLTISNGFLLIPFSDLFEKPTIPSPFNRL